MSSGEGYSRSRRAGFNTSKGWLDFCQQINFDVNFLGCKQMKIQFIKPLGNDKHINKGQVFSISILIRNLKMPLVFLEN